MGIVTAALLKIQKERQERQAREEEEHRERKRQEAEDLVRKMHEDVCDEPPPLGTSFNISDGRIESHVHLPKDMGQAATYMTPVTVVRNYI